MYLRSLADPVHYLYAPRHSWMHLDGLVKINNLNLKDNALKYEYMSKIELYFGNPTCEKEWVSIENYACSTNSSIETSIISNFKYIIKNLTKPNNENDTFFDLSIFIDYQVHLKLPRITTGIYKQNGFILPKMVIHEDYAVCKESNQNFFIENDFIDSLGTALENEFTYSYFGFKRIGKIAKRKD